MGSREGKESYDDSQTRSAEDSLGEMGGIRRVGKEMAGARKTIPVYLDQMTGNTCHQHGTARMGFDPAKSVLNEWCQSHDVENLFVLDGSGFPTATGVNPTLTMIANAWRCSDYIADYYLKGREMRLEQPK